MAVKKTASKRGAAKSASGRDSGEKKSAAKTTVAKKTAAGKKGASKKSATAGSREPKLTRADRHLAAGQPSMHDSKKPHVSNAPKSKYVAATTRRVVKTSPVSSRLGDARIEAAVRAVVERRSGRG
jgi:hypothetical protein